MGPEQLALPVDTPLPRGGSGAGGRCCRLGDTALSKEEAGRELAAGASVSLGLGPWSPSSTWLSRPDSLPGKRSGLKISWRDSRLSWECFTQVPAFQELQLEQLKRKLQRLRPAVLESLGCSSPAKIVLSVPT